MVDSSAPTPNNLDNIQWAVPLFPHLIVPNGFLDQYRHTHALWYYYLCARQTLEASERNLVYEGALDFEEQTDYFNLIRNIAKLYGVQVEEMVKCWHQIDMQCEVLKLPPLPKDDRYRHTNSKLIVS